MFKPQLRYLEQAFITFLLLVVATLLLAGCTGDTTSNPKIGMAYAIGGKGDGSFNDAAYAGLVKAQQELGVEIAEVTADRADTDTDLQKRLRLLAANGCNPVIAVGISYVTVLADVAQEFPATTFAIIDAEVSGPNIASLVFAAEQGSYLAGVIAASASKSGKIGFIGGMEIPLIKAFEAGYGQGARSVNAAIVIESAYMGAAGDSSAWNVPDKARSATEAMLAKGVDVGYAAAGASNLGMFQAIKSAGGPGKGLWAIGTDSDQYTMPTLAAVKEVILTSMLKRVDSAVFDLIKSVVSGTPMLGIQTFDLKRNGVGYAVSNPAIMPYKTAANAAAARIITGEIVVTTQE